LGLRISILTLLLGLLWSAGPYFYKGHSGCSECHTPHYETEASCVDCHRGDDRTRRVQIAHYQLIQGKYACFTLPENSAVRDGHRLIDTSGCRRCHETGGQGNRLSSNLDTLYETTPPEVLADAIKDPATFMPDFYFRETDVTRLVNAILDSSAVYASAFGENIRIIHFEEYKEDSHTIFENRCGSCHRILTAQFGGLGRGDIGPNLSGFFSQFYFKNNQGGKSWDSIGLREWLKNPRDIRDNARMSPVILTENEFAQLIRILTL